MQIAVGRGALGQAKDQPKERRIGKGKIQIPHARPHQPLIRRVGGAGLAGLHTGQQPTKPALGKGGDHACRVAEMMRGGGVADPHPRRHPTQRKARQTAFGQLRLTGIQNRAAQVAVVIA